MVLALTKVGFIGFTTLVAFILGAILGSFVKALADRSLKNRTFLGRSYCPHCKKKLQWYDLFPIVSYIYLGGKCRYCHKKISIEYLLVEVAMGVLIGFLFWVEFHSLQSVFSFQFSVSLFELLYKIFFIAVLAVLFITDFKKMLIPDRISIPAIKISLIALITITIVKVSYLYYYLSQTTFGRLLLPPQSDYFTRHALITAEPLIGSLSMSILLGGFFMALIIITRGKGMGGGDVKLGAFMGLGLGFPQSLVATITAFLLGAAISIILIVLGKKHFGQSIAFGPFLVLGSIIALFWGNEIVNFYLSLSA